MEEIKNEEVKVEVEENQEVNNVENEKIDWKNYILSHLANLIVILCGVIGLIVSLIKQLDTSLSICLISTGVAGGQLEAYLKTKNKVNLACMILWYLVTLLGLLQLILL